MMKLKSAVADLAIAGAPPAFVESLHVGRPNIGQRDRLFERIGEILDRRWLTNNGPVVQEFEHRIAEYLGVKHCIAFCNATIALEVVARALDLSGEVIVPAFTFVATAHALEWQHITPIFCDVDPETHCLDPARVEELITPRTTAILGVHVWGRPCAVEALGKLAERHGLRLIFDAAHAFACSSQGRFIGSFGDAEVFSFHATKFFNTFEGGAITTNDEELARRIRLMKNFGFAGYDHVVDIGTNGKMTEVSAAMGLTSLESVNDFIKVNQLHRATYAAALSDLPGLTLVPFDDTERSNYQYVVFDVDAGSAGLSRDDLLRVLQAENIGARRYFFPGCHRMEPYRTQGTNVRGPLPVTEWLVDRVFQLPTGTALQTSQIEVVSSVIRAALADPDATQDALAGKPVLQAEVEVCL